MNILKKYMSVVLCFVMLFSMTLGLQGSALAAAVESASAKKILPPKVITFFTYTNTSLWSDGYVSGLRIKLPKIDSKRAGAVQINNGIAKFKDILIAAAKKYDNYKEYKVIINVGFSNFVYKDYLCLNVFYVFGVQDGKSSYFNLRYVYDFKKGKNMNNQDLMNRYFVTSKEVLTRLNDKADTQGFGSLLDSLTKVYLYISKDGELYAEAQYSVKAYPKPVSALIAADPYAIEAPKSVIAFALPKGGIKIRWNSVEDAEKYCLYRSTSRNGVYGLIKLTSLNSFVNESVTPGKTYYYKLRAYKEFMGKRYYSKFSELAVEPAF